MMILFQIQRKKFCFLQVHIFGYNAQLFSNFSEAETKSHGVVALAVMVQVRVCYIYDIAVR